MILIVFLFVSRFETSNGISRSETGDFDEGKGVFRVEGFYTYVAPNNVRYYVQYTADENGFRPRVRMIEEKHGGELGEKKILEEFPDNIGTNVIISLLGGGVG